MKVRVLAQFWPSSKEKYVKAVVNSNQLHRTVTLGDKTSPQSDGSSDDDKDVIKGNVYR